MKPFPGRWYAAVLFGLLLACGAEPDGVRRFHPELLNPDFAAPLDSGWHRETRNYDGRSEFLPLPEGGITVRKTLCGWARLSQAVAVRGRVPAFRARARFGANSNRVDYHARASVALAYLDSTGTELGETRWYLSTGGPVPGNSSTRRHIPVSRAAEWHELELDLAEELQRNLPGIRSDNLHALRITFEAWTSGTRGC